MIFKKIAQGTNKKYKKEKKQVFHLLIVKFSLLSHRYLA